MKQLDHRIFSNPPAELELPGYPRRHSSENRIVHLGVGAFHRAHQALYTDKANGNWRITGASLRSEQVQQQLLPQDYLYTVVERENDRKHYRLVQAIDEIIVAPQQPQRLIDAMAADNCKLISLTITEKGYCHQPATGRLERTHPDIVHDLANLATPRSAPGFLVAALQKRFQQQRNGVSILSCDNLPANGQLTRQVVLDLAMSVDSTLAAWIDEQVSFPSSMVDRIVPATTDSDRRALAETLGYRDEAMVVCEPFSQWVIEENFVQGRPAWEQAGATFVDSVHEFETMKLRLLNGSHSSMAYLGFLAGYEYIYQVMANEHFAAFIRYLMDKEVTPTLNTPPQIDIDLYKTQLVRRFSNRALEHRTQQIAMDGSQKLPQRILQPIAQQLLTGGPIDGLCLSVAGWICYSRGTDESGQHYTVSDPLAEQLQKNDRPNQNKVATWVRGILAIEAIFPTELSQQKLFIDTTQKFVEALLRDGAKKTVSKFIAQYC